VPIVFLHGITVREERFQRLVQTVRDGLALAGCSLGVTGFYWGDLGRSPRYRGASIPGFTAGHRALGPPEGRADSSSALLMLLLEDPLAELTDLRDESEFGLDAAGYLPIPPVVEERNAQLRRAAKSVSVRAEELAGSAAVDDLVHRVFTAAAGADRRIGTAALCAPMARAITAGLFRLEHRPDDFTGAFRWNDTAGAVEAVLADQLGGERGVAGHLGARALTLALRHGMRNRMMPGLSLFLGDVLAWFANRERILLRLDQAIDQAVAQAGADGPLVLIGHSLGGVIAFEYCARSGRPVTLLATVGSQVGMLGEMGVLEAGAPPPDGKLAVPGRIGTWVNYYEPDDVLSFLAEPVFDRVADIDIDTRAPFPISHGEYWNLPDTYVKLAAAVRRG
jgi:hypothetical protein